MAGLIGQTLGGFPFTAQPIAAGTTQPIWAMAEDPGQSGFTYGFGSDIQDNLEQDTAVLNNASGQETHRRKRGHKCPIAAAAGYGGV